MNNYKTGKFIQQLRIEKGYTQKELSEKLNCTDKAISRWETGKGLPDVSFLIPLSELFGVSVNEILLGERISKGNSLRKLMPFLLTHCISIKKRNALPTCLLLCFFA